MKSHHVILDGALYRLTRESWRRVLMQWARSGERPDFTEWKGVKPLAAVMAIDHWSLVEVEMELLSWLRAGRDGSAVPVGEPARDVPPHVIQPMGNDWKLLQIVDTQTGEVVASSLTPRQAERMIQEGVK